MSQGKEANLGSAPRPRLKRGAARAKPVDVHRRADARAAQIGSPAGRPGAAAPSRQPVLVVNVDVEASSPTDESRWRRDVRLVPPSGGAMPERRSDAYNGEVTAVVILRDATASHVASCVRAATRGNGLIGTCSGGCSRSVTPERSSSGQDRSSTTASTRCCGCSPTGRAGHR